MRELNGTGLQVSILGTAPPLQDNEIARPALEQLVRHYLAADGATGNRFLSVRVGSGNFRLLRRFPRLRHILENHVRIVAGLRSRSEERRGGKEGVSTCRYRWSTEN